MGGCDGVFGRDRAKEWPGPLLFPSGASTRQAMSAPSNCKEGRHEALRLPFSPAVTNSIFSEFSCTIRWCVSAQPA